MKKLIIYTSFLFSFCQYLHSQSCTPQGNEVSYGSNDTWRGYVYDNQNFTNYKGYVNEGTAGNPNFDQSFGGDNVNYSTNGCTVQTETFSARYKLSKTFSNASYDFTVGGDDGFRLSLDGGATWVINRWNDQGYTTTTYTAALNGTYNLVLEYYENGGGNRLSFSVVTGCAGAENTAVYGNSNIWKGYVYDGINFDIYKGMIQQGSSGNINFDQNFGGSNVQYATSGCSVQTETFSVRYRLTKSFVNGSYLFIVGGDDGFRLSFDGGSTWAINRWYDQSYNTTSASVNLNGTYNIVLEFYESGGDNRLSLTMQAGIALNINLLSFTGRKETNAVVLDWNISPDSDPFNFDVERSADGNLFNSIQTIPGTSGTFAATNREYTFTDASPLTGRSFYRLKMTDLQGKISYSYIVAIQGAHAKPGELTLFPAIITSNIVYCKSGMKINKAIIRVTDMYGRLVHQQLIGKIERGQTVGIPAGANMLTKGLYLFTILDNDKQLITQRVILQ
ncbi:MAG: hypothetical protein WDO71_19600 [Bacteroidota bacterium]